MAAASLVEAPGQHTLDILLEVIEALNDVRERRTQNHPVYARSDARSQMVDVAAKAVHTIEVYDAELRAQARATHDAAGLIFTGATA